MKPPPGPRTLGPVDSLERHVPPDWWREVFGALYLKTDGDVVEDDAATRVEVDDIVRALSLTPGEQVLDLCCGQGRHTLELARRGFGPVVGFDRSRYLVRLARKRAREAGLSVRFHEGDARRVDSRRERFDAVLCLGNAFGYFHEPQDDLRVLRAVVRVLRPGGRFFLDITDGAWMKGHFDARSWEWLDTRQFACRERELSADGSRLISREVVVDAEEGVLVDQFYAERLYDVAGITALLEEAGFTDVRLFESLDAMSERNQDLGMMARRLRLVACAPAARATPPTPAPAPASRRCVALLGDPRLPDAVKLDGVFSADDLETVARLKAALGQLDGIHFDYLDEHGAMLSALAADPPAFALNFCDEGLKNQLAMELHVPAMLEALGIPYSGSGPSCLALCFDKEAVRALAMGLGIPVPAEVSLTPGLSPASMPALFPGLLKPVRGDGSVGITTASVVQSPAEAVQAHAALAAEFPGVPILLQEFLSGAEYSVGIVGNPGHGYRVLPVLRVDYSGLPAGLPPILGYESKWDPASPYWTEVRFERAPEGDEAVPGMVASALKLFERLGCRDYARFDFRADAAGVVKLLEVNPNPGWCWDGKLAFMAGFDGVDYPTFLGWIVEAALRRNRLEGLWDRPGSAG